MNRLYAPNVPVDKCSYMKCEVYSKFLFHIFDRDLMIGGFLIPAGTTVQMNLFSVLRGNPNICQDINIL